MRGYGKWKRGEMSDKDFKRNMAKEFASVTNPYTGKGHYPGQGAKPLDISGAMISNASSVKAGNPVETDDDFTTSSLDWSDKKVARWWDKLEQGEA